jgi:tight adherence protein B
MRFYREILESAGLGGRFKEVTALLTGSTVVFAVIIWGITSVPGLALCLSVLFLAAGIEVIRVRGSSRQAAFDRLWPQVFDSFQNASLSGIPLGEQLEYLAESGPERLRQIFSQLARDLELGKDIQIALQEFKQSIGSRHADFLAILVELSSELGGHGMARTWEQAAKELREEQALMGQVLAKQGWVSGSAKIALVAPWLIALVLIQLPQNKAAFASELGALVLLFGLTLSVVAYALVNKLGALTLPGRIFHGT